MAKVLDFGLAKPTGPTGPTALTAPTGPATKPKPAEPPKAKTTARPEGQ
jgi:hypothetical protein